MSRRTLSPEEVRKRLIRLRNLEYLHEQQRFKIWYLRDENIALKKEVAQLKMLMSDQQHTIDDLKLQMEELRAIIFGKKRDKEKIDIDDISPHHEKTARPRTPASYRRILPTEDEVTETKEYPIQICNHCHGQFSEHESATCYVEDIPLPQKKIVIKYVVEKGYCSVCRKWSMSAPLPTSDVMLGNNVKRYATYLSVICRQSYSQIQDILRQTYDFDISQGEIAKILDQEGNRLRPEFERLKVRIRGEPSVHLDETSWNLMMGDGYRTYAWTMVGGASSESVFALGKTRGKGNADDLLKDSKAVVVSDDYGAYRNLENPHQLCCAHILRKLRDLARSSEIKGEIRDHCVGAYRTFAAIYADIEVARTSSAPTAAYAILLERLRIFTTVHTRDPAKLTRIKKQVAPRTQNYLTCLLHPQVASDNNAAERSLRHLVLKRKICFGSFREKTAETLAILFSVLLSHRQRGTLKDYLIGV